MIEEEFLQLFQNEEVELQTVDRQPIEKENIQAAALQKIRVKELALMMQDMSWDDRYEWLMYQKNKGNKLFYQQQYDRAIQVYQEMAGALDLNNTEEKNEIMKQDFQNPIIFNLALCFKKKKDYAKASLFYDMAVKISPTPLQVLRRGFYHFDIQEYEKAQNDLDLIQNVDQNPDIKDDYYDLKQKLRQVQKKDKELYQRMFQQNSDDETQPPIKQSKLDSFYDWTKGLIQRIFGCRGLFDDDESEDEDDDDSDPKKFLESR